MIHGYELNGYYIVLDISSGSIHQVDPVAFDVIMKYQDFSEDEIVTEVLKKYKEDPSINREEVEEIFVDVRELIHQKKLFTPHQEWESLSNQLWKQGDSCEEKQPEVKAL